MSTARIATSPVETAGVAQAGAIVYRHRLATRLWHWGNVIVVFTLLSSGLTIFNAHPRLYWGDDGANADYAFFQIGSTTRGGYVRFGDVRVPTTGVLGQWQDSNGTVRHYAFPSWATLPTSYNLAFARRWHLTFAWLFAVGTAGYLLWSLGSRHLTRDLLPNPAELRPRHLWQEIVDHVRLRFPGGAHAAHYNSLQKLSYVGVLLLLLPLLVLTGLTMSPAIDAAWPWLLDLFGGRQSARTLHFLAALGIVLFVIVHLAMVVLSGPLNEVRSMITGRFRLPPETNR